MTLAPGAVVVAHLVHPTEKLWGELLELQAAGVILRALNLESLEDWAAELAKGEPPGSGPVVTFVPMHRVERLFLDEQAGAVESHCQRLERRVGRPALELLRGA
ncbi:MAG: hypothetical protein KJ058_17575 [Thermoanaerobaculia bacterium]|nr:hypothetical protein [Thermoanaerobaculia bacterium]MCZ7651527.1 hypothetical protein [Thermoanaerobaculia bacterium]